MSLKVWLPLQSNLNNLGLTDVTLSSGTAGYGDGKIGKCLTSGTLTFNVSDNLIANLGSNNIYSMCCWVREINSATSRWLFYIGNGTGYQRGLWSTSATNSRHWAYSGSGVNIPTSISTVDGKWHHIAFVSSGATVKMYVDGIYQGQTTNAKTDGLTSNILVVSANNAYLNDFRLYDHCLSAKEVKEISKGLVLHYKLDNNGVGNPNYFRNSYAPKLIPCKYSESTYSDPQSVTIDTQPLIGTFWKVSRGASGGGDIRFGWQTNDMPVPKADYLNKKVIMSMYVYSTTGTTIGQLNLGVYSDKNISGMQLEGNSSYTVPAQTWTRVVASKTFTSVDAAATDENRLEFYTSCSLNTDIIIACVKLEISDVATPWCPSTADTQYASLGLNDNVEYDCSGYSGNGTKESISANRSTPRYSASETFNGTTSTISFTRSGIGTVLNNPCTIAFWLYSNDAGGRSIYFSAYNASPFWCLEKTATNTFRYDWNGTVDLYSTVTVPDKTWTHVVFVRESTTSAKLYFNGELKHTYTGTTSSLSLGDTWRLGRDVRTNDGTPLNGSMSDFRIYATALSANDVKELYQVSASIDNSGKMFAYSFEEV